MYKLEPVVADGGELIIYAPHISEVSVTHGEIIKKIGYHVRDYFVKQMDKFQDIPGGIMAHSTHVKGAGVYENGVEKPRVNVVLATAIPEEMCRKINLGYRDPATIDPVDWQNRESEGYLYVPKAGEILYRLKNEKYYNTNMSSCTHFSLQRSPFGRRSPLDRVSRKANVDAGIPNRVREHDIWGHPELVSGSLYFFTNIYEGVVKSDNRPGFTEGKGSSPP
jgi:hypothetical protein